MFNRILLPLDRSTLAECVLPHAIAVARAFESQVTLLHVMDAPREARRRATDPLNWQIRKTEAETYLHELDLRLQAAGLLTETHILEGSAAEQVIAFSDTHAPQLIILSSHGQSGLSDWGVSSVVQKIVLRARTSVMIVYAAQPMTPDVITGLRYQRILVPMDGTQRAEYILPAAATLARAHDAQIVLAHIVQKPPMPRRTRPSREDVELADQLVERNQAEATQYLDQLRSRITGKVEARVLVSDHLATTLQELVEQENSDLVLLSAHGRSSETRGLYGDVVSNLIAYGTTPLVIMRPSAQAQSAPTSIRVADGEPGGR